MNKFKDFAAAAFATALGFGYSPKIPGTVGTIPAVAGFLVIMKTVPPERQTLAIAIALGLACLISVALGPWAEKKWGRKDPKQFVLDEVAGFFLTVLLYRGPSLMVTTVAAFLATRIFDILKLPPARRLEKLPQGWGILMDDLAASVHAAIVLNLLAISLPAYF